MSIKLPPLTPAMEVRHDAFIPAVLKTVNCRAKRVNGLSYARLSRQNRPEASPDAIASGDV